MVGNRNSNESLFFVDRQHLLAIKGAIASGEAKFTLPPDLAAISQFVEINIGDIKGQHFANGECRITINAASFEEIKCSINIKSGPIAEFNIKNNCIEAAESKNLLTTYEIKSLAHFGNDAKIYNTIPDLPYSPSTDLHTHYAGAMKKEDLLSVATDNGQSPYYYPLKLLKQMGIAISQYENNAFTSDKFPQQTNVDSWFRGEVVKYIDIRTLKVSDNKILLDHLAIPQTKQIIFEEMEDYYNYRGVFTTDIKLFEKYLRALANNYKEVGVNNASISLSKIIHPDWLQIADKCLPEIEAETGVKMRFLVSIMRHDKPEKMQDVIRSIQATGHHPCIEGVDFLASETNSTYDFYPALHEIGAWAQANDPGFVLRIHAGETSYHPENIKAALEIAEQYNLPIRVGHGIYGSGADTVALAKKIYEGGTPVIIEMNPDSNYALNNIDNTDEFPLVTYAQAGIPCVLGTDGHGLYQTDSRQVSHILNYLNADPTQIVKALKDGDELYSKLNEVSYKYKYTEYHKLLDPKVKEQIAQNPSMSQEEALKKGFNEIFKLPDASKMTPKSVYDKYAADEKMKREELIKNINTNKTQIESDKTKVKKDLAGKTPIMITGAIIGGGLELMRQNQALIMTLLLTMDPKKAYFATSGTDFGIQKILHECVTEYNKNQADPEQRFSLLGHIANKADPDGFSTHLTHASFDYERWYDIYRKINDSIEKDNLQLVVIGGTMLTRDIIQSAYNVVTGGDPSKTNNNLYLVLDSGGAAKDKAKHLPQQFSTDFSAIAPKLFLNNKSLFKVGIDEGKIRESQREEVEALKNDPKKIKTQGVYSSITDRDKSKWLVNECNRFNIVIQENVALDFFKKNCPVGHKIAEILKPVYNSLSSGMINILELSKIQENPQSKFNRENSLFGHEKDIKPQTVDHSPTLKH